MNKVNIYFVALDWTISLGIGLITFASLETTGIYFGLGKCSCTKDRMTQLPQAHKPAGWRFPNSPQNSP